MENTQSQQTTSEVNYSKIRDNFMKIVKELCDLTTCQELSELLERGYDVLGCYFDLDFKEESQNAKFMRCVASAPHLDESAPVFEFVKSH